ncbi:hypothetical protein ACUOFC_52515, partial [Escherichia sp. TWPC-MK]
KLKGGISMLYRYIDELFYIKFKELRDRIISVFCDLNIPNSLIVIKELYYNKYNQNIIYIAMRQIMELSIFALFLKNSPYITSAQYFFMRLSCS